MRMRKFAAMAMALAATAAMAVTMFAQQPGEQQPKPAAVVPADQQPTDAQLAKLFEVMRIKEQLATTARMMPQMLQQQIKQQLAEMEKERPTSQPMTDQQREAQAQIMNRFMTRVMGLYPPDEMLADMAAVYKRHLTAEDVDAVTAFYGTPAGQHMLDMTSAVVSEFMPAVMQKMQTRVRPLVLEMSKEMSDVMKAPQSGASPEQK
jgi:hypothetical protein